MVLLQREENGCIWAKEGGEAGNEGLEASFDVASTHKAQVFSTSSRLRERIFRLTCFSVFLVAALALAVIVRQVAVPPALDRNASRVIEALMNQKADEEGSAAPILSRDEGHHERGGPGATKDKSKSEKDVLGKVLLSPNPHGSKPMLLGADPFGIGLFRAGAHWAEAHLFREIRSPLTYVFLTEESRDALYSLEANRSGIDVFVPAWLHITEAGDLLQEAEADRTSVMDALEATGPPPTIMPSLDNIGPSGAGMAGPSRLLGASESSRNTFARKLVRSIREAGGSGLVIDFRDVQQNDLATFAAFVGLVVETLRDLDMPVVVRAPLFDRDGAWKAATAEADRVILYDADYAWDPPAVIAHDRSAAIAAALAAWRAVREAQEISVELAGPSYRIPLGSLRPTPLSHGEVIRLQAEARSATTYARGSLGTFVIDGKKGGRDSVFIQDGATYYNMRRLMVPAGIDGVAIRHMGREDPAIWRLIEEEKRTGQLTPAGLSELDYLYPMETVGKGEVFRIDGRSAEGRQKLAFDGEGYVTSRRVITLPQRQVLRRWGGENARKIVLTFDDGPDPRYTPAILRILRDLDAPAAFFVLGHKALSSPGIVRQMSADGHEIGNHTFSHPDLSRIGEMQMKVELAATQRVLESMIGRDTLLFRPPYGSDQTGNHFAETQVAARASGLGYLLVDMYVDPKDWFETDDEKIAQAVVEAVERGDGNVVLLHDAGGDRTPTIEALPRIIMELRSRGYEIVSLAELVGLAPDALMPAPQDSPQQLQIQATSLGFLSAVSAWTGYLVFAAIVLGVLRVAVVMLLAAIPRRHPKPDPDFQPLVSVVIPAYNEERVVVRTVTSILASTYPRFEVIVVDDGSTDETLQVLRDAYSGTAVRVMTKPNGGKASALNLGISIATGDIVVALDADTIYRPDTIAALVRHFADASVAAVAGNAKVGNRNNLITRLQALEYITAQNLDRRAFEVLGAITVVPGAVGAWRREALKGVGYYSSDTVAEDADLTISLLRAGWRITYAPDAIAYTEAPDTIRGLARQRHRWAFGTLQNVWKHRGSMVRPERPGLCFAAFPHMLLFQFVLPLLAPVADVAFVISLIALGIHKWFHPAIPVDTDVVLLFQSYLAFCLVDAAASLTAFIAERKEDARLIRLVPVQRLIYRQILYYVLIRAVAAAIKGKLARWDKLERSATVSVAS